MCPTELRIDIVNASHGDAAVRAHIALDHEQTAAPGGPCGLAGAAAPVGLAHDQSRLAALYGLETRPQRKCSHLRDL